MFHTLFKFKQPPSAKARAVVMAAVKHTLVTSVLGQANQSKILKKTNGWALFHQPRYNRNGQYIKRANAFDPITGKLKASVKTDCYIDANSGKGKVPTTMNRYYRIIPDPDNNNYCIDHPNKVGVRKVAKQWFYQCDEIAKAHDAFIYFTPKDPAKDPLYGPTFALEEADIDLLLMAVLGQTKRASKCQERCCMIAKYLWENSRFINRIELLSFNFDHVIVVVNRPKESELDKPKTWGPYTLVIDSWYAPENISTEETENKWQFNSPEKYVYTAAEFMERAKAVYQFMQSEAPELNNTGFGCVAQNEASLENITWTCINDICPKEQPYPVFPQKPNEPKKNLEDYYNLRNAYPMDLINTPIPKGFSSHRHFHAHQFKPALEQITSRAKMDDDKQLEQAVRKNKI